MKYTLNKPDGTEVQFRCRYDFVIAYNNHEVDANKDQLKKDAKL